MQQADEITILEAERDLEHSLLSSTFPIPFYKKVFTWITWPIRHPFLTVFLYIFLINFLT